MFGVDGIKILKVSRGIKLQVATAYYLIVQNLVQKTSDKSRLLMPTSGNP